MRDQSTDFAHGQEARTHHQHEVQYVQPWHNSCLSQSYTVHRHHMHRILVLGLRVDQP